MDTREFILNYYRDASDGMHVQCIRNSDEAQKPHSHNYYQIYYVAAGTVTHFTGLHQGTLNRGDMFIIPPGMRHYIRTSPDALFYTFSFMPEIFGQQESFNTISIHFLKNLEATKAENIRPVVQIPAEDILHIEDLFKQMLKIFQKKVPGSDALLRAYGNLLITLLAKHYFDNTSTPDFPVLKNNRRTILQGLSYIDQNYMEDLTLDHLARYCAMSRSSFSSIFSKVAGTSFHCYLNKCRIRHAQRYIQEGYGITDVGRLCGYKDFSTFYRNFKALIGMTPKAYQKQFFNTNT